MYFQPICSGHWKFPYPTSFVFRIQGDSYVYGQSKVEQNWFTQRVDKNGKLVKQEADNGSFDHYFDLQLPVAVGERVFLFRKSSEIDEYFLQEFNGDGTLVREYSDHGSLTKDFERAFVFYEQERCYLYCELNDLDFMIRGISYDGKLGGVLNYGGGGDHKFRGRAVFTVGSSTFLFSDGVDDQRNTYKIWSLEENGRAPVSRGPNSVMGGPVGSFRIGGVNYLFRQDFGSLKWYLFRLHNDLSLHLDSVGEWSFKNQIVSPFSYRENQFIFTLRNGKYRASGSEWCVLQLTNLDGVVQ